MITTTKVHTTAARRRLAGLLAAAAAASLLAGCSTLAGKPAAPLLAKREEPGVVLCMSQRAGAGLRLVGQLNQGIYPITRATVQYRIADVSDPVPASTEAGDGFQLTNARSTKVPYRKGADEVVFTVDGDAARALRDKVLWYRWIITYDRGGSERTDVTAIHRTSLAEAGLPRAAGRLGPDMSVAQPTTRRR
ncbi:MAG: hypothetical protein ABR538_07955 [Candidatus Binatia bacterium]